MRALIVHNRKSGFGSDAIFEFERALVMPGDECVMRLLFDQQYDYLALADAERFDVVVISGGDGTVTNVLHTLANRDVPACIFPSGTANLFASNLGNASEPAALARACRVGNTATLDLGEIVWEHEDGSRGGRGFGLMAGSGFDAKLMSAAIPNKGSLGEAAYFTAALSNRKPEVISFTIEIDGEAFERRGIACLVANSAKIQGDMQIVHGSSMDDGYFEVIILEVSDTIQLIRPLFTGLIDREGKKIGRPYIEAFRGRHIKVTPHKPIQMEIDGDVIDGEITSWEAQVLPKAVPVIVDDFSDYGKREETRGRASARTE